MTAKSPLLVPLAWVLSLMAQETASAQFVEDFESLNALTAGGSIVGQGGWTTLAGGWDPILVRTYAGLSNQLAHPAGGGLKLVGGPWGSRSALHSVGFGPGAWSIAFDAYSSYVAPISYAAVGIYLEPDGAARGTRIYLSSSNSAFGGPTSRVEVQTHTALGAAQALSIPGAGALTSSQWYRVKIIIDFASNRILQCRVQNLHTGATTTHHPQTWYLGGGANPAAAMPLPSAVSIRTSVNGSALNLGFDNLRIEPADEWQVNQSDSTLHFDGAEGTTQNPASSTKCLGSSIDFAVASSGGGLPWDLGISALAPVPLGAGGMMTTGGQILNLDLADPSFTWLLGLSGSIPFSSFTSAVSLTNPGCIAAQLFVISPSRPEGIAISGASELNVVANSATVQCHAGPATNDGSVAVTIPGGWPALRFCEQAWTSVFINANGLLSFGAPVSTPTPTVASFLAGPPSLALLWTDLDPSAGGSITAVLDIDGGSPDYLFSYQAVAAASGGASARQSVSVRFSGDSTVGGVPTTQSASLRFQVDPAHTLDSLIGISPGNGANPFPVQFNITPSGSNPPTDSVFEFRQSGVPVGFGSITMPFADPTQWSVN